MDQLTILFSHSGFQPPKARGSQKLQVSYLQQLSVQENLTELHHRERRTKTE